MSAMKRRVRRSKPTVLSRICVPELLNTAANLLRGATDSGGGKDVISDEFITHREAS